MTNTGSRISDEVVQLYVKDLEASTTVPHHELRGFERITLAPGESRQVTFPLTPRELSLIDDAGRRILEPGTFRLFVGGSQPDARSLALTGQKVLSVDVELVGKRREIEY